MHSELTRHGAPFPVSLLQDWPGMGWINQFTPPVRIEEYTEGGEYVLRADLPGVDPAEHLHVRVADGAVRLHAERVGVPRENLRTEVHYGTFDRVVHLPVGVRDDTVTASYVDGVLEIRAALGEAASPGRVIDVKVA
ncbi:Hsp20/alpha crystallin family protein [Longispora sp. K20-0274]|uniref:Hsp20/alpha crystallin family protein n=1 Tax=Longispora sp. K20-0274 TaxID=3088255 RepID=UPI00399B7248